LFGVALVLIGVRAEEEIVDRTHRHQAASPTTWKGRMASTLVECVGQNGTAIEIRRYVVGGKEEFRFPWRDNLGKRHFKCARTLDEARRAAQDFLTGRWPVADTSPLSVAPPATEQPTVIPRDLNRKRFEEVCTEFLEARRGKYNRDEIRYASFRDDLTRIEALKTVLGGVRMNEMDVRLLDKALLKFDGLSARSLWNYRNQLHSVLRWAVNRGDAPESLLKAFGAMAVRGSKDKDEEDINPFTPEEVVAILEAARNNRSDPTGTPFRMVAAIAMQAFGGLRATESCRTEWERIDLEQGVIRVRKATAKVKRSRTIPMVPNLVKWLNIVPEPFRHGPVYSALAYSKARGRLARRVSKKLPGFRWKGNGLRSAFISHFTAYSDSLTETAYRAGTSERKIRENYWKLVSNEAAQAYFRIEPESCAPTVRIQLSPIPAKPMTWEI
jgi:integrase